MTSSELFGVLFESVRIEDKKWWPNYGSFEVVIGAILTQNTKWQKVESALLNLQKAGVVNLDDFIKIDRENLANLIKPSGFYNTKAKRIKDLTKAIGEEFFDFENFKENVSREWLIGQKGIGAESCDAILCYGCGRDEMVVDNYALRILDYFGYEFESYDECKEWLMSLDFDEIFQLSGANDINEIYCLYHGLIVEFCKAHLNGKKFDDFAVNLFKIFTN